jgi:hypothetical protein
LDSTSIHVDGQYKNEDAYTAIQLVRGYSRNHRPELNQVVLNLITENKAGIPVYMQAATLTIMKVLKISLRNISKVLKLTMKIATSSQMPHCIRQKRSDHLINKINCLSQEHHKS